MPFVMLQILVGEQDLCDAQIEARKELLVSGHEPRLADRKKTSSEKLAVERDVHATSSSRVRERSRRGVNASQAGCGSGVNARERRATRRLCHSPGGQLEQRSNGSNGSMLAFRKQI